MTRRKTDRTTEHMKTVAREWIMARNVIASFIKELRPDLSQEHHEHNAAAIIARLASHEPPILLEVSK